MLDRYQPAFNHQAKELVKSIEPLAGKGETSIWVKASDVTLNTVCNCRTEEEGKSGRQRKWHNQVSRREVQDELNTIIATGYDTLSTVIPYTLMLIGTFPELPYLDAVFKESVRLFPPVPIVSRDCNEELQLKNYKLPAGCHCTIGIWAILRLPIWGPDAEQFRPERWLEPDSLPKSPGAYCSFSLGKRNCI
ncbi:hypothetical protein MSG28_004340, partial [Choristoneura fumiferana]